MANRTITLGEIFNNFTCCYCLILVTLYLQFTITHATEDEAATTSLNASSTLTNSTFLTPVAEALVRYRRQPLTVVKHIIRPRRIKVKRIKRPKIKYSFAEPPPHLYYKSISKPPPSPSVKHAPLFDASIFEDFSHINVESADFNAPPSSYEAQSMDLDLYSSYEKPAEEQYKSSKKPTYTYSEPEVTYKQHPSIPTYSFESSKKSLRKPHTKYGVPTEFVYSTDYETHSGGPSYSFNKPSYETSKVVESPKYHEYSYEPNKVVESPKYHEVSHGPYKVVESPKYHEVSHGPNKVVEGPKYHEVSNEPNKIVETPEYHSPSYEEEKAVEKPSYFEPEDIKYTYAKPMETVPRIPATTYGVPDMPIPSKNFDSYNKYSIVEQQPPMYENYDSFKPNQHNFAEPPAHEHNVKVMYSPSYEINIPPVKGGHPSDYETHPQQYEPSQPEPHPPPSHPTQQHGHSPSSPHQDSSDTHQPASYEPAPSQDLPINQNHRHPTYDYPKSSYEVPIYDPIPFDSSINEEQEIYPPQSYNNTKWREASPEYEADANNISEQIPSQEVVESHDSESDERPLGDTHSSGTKPTTDVIPPRVQRTRKRKRTKGSTASLPIAVVGTKHILDVPELRQAFENEKRQHELQKGQRQHQQTPDDTDFNESHKVENTNNVRWNPMRIHTRPMSVTTSSPPTLAVNYQHPNGNAKRPQMFRPRTTTTTTTTPSPYHQLQPEQSKVDIVSIEKSRSKSYYDGILSTPKIFNPYLYKNRFKTHLSTVSTTTTTTTAAPQTPVAANKERFSKRTTKNVFDTTIFKSPLNDRDVYRNLPKNHKLF